MSKLELKRFYDFEENEGSITAMLKPPNIVEEIFVYLLFIIPFAFLGCIGIIKGKWFYAITGCLALLLVIIGWYFGHKFIVKRQSVFRFSIGKNGITLVDLDGNYYIPWLEISSFGIVNGNGTSGGKVKHTQACIYFSRDLIDEHTLRKMLCRRVENTGSTNRIIVFCFFFDTDKYEEYDLFRKYIYMYCDKSKERNYVEELF